MEACHAALKRLQVDYLDLYYCHRPDLNTPMEETVRAMHDLIQQGKVLYWGTSEWSAQEIQEAYTVARAHHLTPPVVEQPQYNMFHRERVEKEYYKLYDGMGLGTTIWSPLASGLLTGKYQGGKAPEGTRANMAELGWLKDVLMKNSQKYNEQIAKLTELAHSIQATLPQLAIAWCMKNPQVSTVILGASKVEQLTENLKALEIYPKLTTELMEQIETILDNKPAIARW